MPSLYKRIYAGVLWVAFGAGAQVVLQFSLLVVLSRLLSPSEFGLVTAAMTVVVFSTIFSQLGVGPALVQREALTDRHVSAAWTLSLALGGVLCSATYFLADVIEGLYRIDGLAELLRILAFVFPLTAAGVVAESLLQRNMKFKALTTAKVASYAFGYAAVSLILAFLGFGAKSLVYGSLSQALLYTVVVFVSAVHPVRLSADLRSVGELTRFGFGLTLAKIGNYVATQGDYVIVGRMLGAASLGAYSRAYQLLMLPANLIGTVLDKVLFPALSSIKSDKASLQDVYEKGVSLVALLTISLSVFSAVFAGEIVGLVLGAQWGEVVLPFQILISVLFFRAAYKVNESLVRAAGAVYRLAATQWVYALLVVLLSLLGAYWGLHGVAVGVSIAVTVNYFMTALVLRLVIGFSWKRNIALFLPGLCSGLVVLVAALFAKIYLTIALSNIESLLVGLLVVGGVLAISIWISPRIFIGETGQWVLSKMRSRRA